MRQDVHTLFDKGYLTVDPRYNVVVSRRIKEEFDNGAEYYSLNGKRILIPEDKTLRPSPDALAWHNEHVFRS